MNLLKSLFISVYMSVSVAIAFYGAWVLLRGGAALPWVGVLLTVVPILRKLGSLMLFRREARTSAHFPLFNALGLLGVGLALAGWFSGRGPLAAGLAVIGWGGFLLYVFWYSKLARSPSPALAVGAILPRLTLRDPHLIPVRSEQLINQPTIWLFYRGNWCPLCKAQIKELAERRNDFVGGGVRVVLVSPQPVAHTTRLSDQYPKGFDFLVDEGNAAARLLGINDPFGVPMGMQMLGYASETVLPTVILTAPGGQVLWTDQTENYRVRPEPDTYLAVLRQHGLLRPAAQPEIRS